MEYVMKWHYIFFFGSEKATKKEFGKMHYHSILSTHKTNPEFQIIYHTNISPEGYYWDLVKDYVEVRIVDAPTSAFGNEIIHPAHQSDWYRLNLLIDEGGIYTDFDTIQLKSFYTIYKSNDLLKMGKTNKTGNVNNGVILAPKPQSVYLKAWREEWANFKSKGRDRFWLDLSVKIHDKLQKDNELQVLPAKYFYPFVFMAGPFLFKRQAFKKTLNSYSVHLYDSHYHKEIDAVTDEEIQNPHNTYTKLLNVLLNTEMLSDKKTTALF